MFHTTLLSCSTPQTQRTSPNGSWYLHIVMAVTNTTSGLAVMQQPEVVPLSFPGHGVPVVPSLSPAPQLDTPTNDLSIGPSSSPSVPVYAIVLMCIMLAVFLVVCSVTSVLFCFSLKQRWLLRNQAAAASQEEKGIDCKHWAKSPSSVETEVPSSASSKTVQARQKKSLQFLLYKATEMYRQGNNTAAMTIPDKPVPQRSSSLPDLHARNATQPGIGTMPQLLLPAVSTRSGHSTAQFATVRPISHLPMMKNDVNNKPIVVRPSKDTSSHLKEQIPHRTMPRKVSVHSVGWYEQYQARQKALASYAQLYLAAGAATPEPGTSPSTRL